MISRFQGLLPSPVDGMPKNSQDPPSKVKEECEYFTLCYCLRCTFPVRPVLCFILQSQLVLYKICQCGALLGEKMKSDMGTFLFIFCVFTPNFLIQTIYGWLNFSWAGLYSSFLKPIL